MKHTKEDILALNPCSDGLRFVEQCGFDAVKIYNTCQRGDWLIWWLRKTGAIDKAQAVKLAISCAERVLVIYEKKRPGDLWPRQAIEVAKAWVENPTEENRQAAAYAATAYATYAYTADAAAAAADAAADASTAYAANAAAAADYAAYAATAYAAYAYAANAAAAAAADAARAAADDAGKKERQWQADRIREIIPCPFEI